MSTEKLETEATEARPAMEASPQEPAAAQSPKPTLQTQIRRNERRSARSIYATREPAADPVVSIAASKPAPSRQRVRKTDSQTSLDQSSTPSSPLPDTTTNTKPLLKYKPGMTVEARDEAKEWYRAKVVDVDESQMRVKVHFLGWNSRFDQWFEAKSSDLKIAKSRLATDPFEANLSAGDKVMAKWKDEFYYPAFIVRQVEREDPEVKFFEIRFTDKVKKVVRVENLRAPTDDELKLGLFETKPTTSSETTTPQEDVVPPSTPTTSTTTDDQLNRKSLRVKRLRTFTEEIVFDSPSASIAYNLASVHKQISVSSTGEPPVDQSSSSSKKRKPSNENESSTKKQVKNYLKSLKLFKASSKKLVPKQVKTKQVEKRPTSKKIQEETKMTRPKINRGLLAKKRSHESEDKKLKKKKKLKRDKKKLFEQLIETSKKQLKHQQALIAKQLKRHEHKKSQKKMHKLLKRQLKEQQQQQSIYPNSSFFFPTGCSNELILSQLLQIQMSQALLSSLGSSNQLMAGNAPVNKQQSAEMTTAVPEQQPEREKISREPIPCTVENCSKKFRKQSLLDYHLKYHHHISEDQLPLTASVSIDATAKLNDSSSTPAPKKRRLSSTNLDKSLKKRSFLKLTSLSSSLNKNGAAGEDDVDVDETDDVFIGDLVGLSDSNESGRGVDPYEVIHCKCGSHSSVGFMIQCDTCLCWQHGECVNLKKGDPVPSNYACWVCSQPENKLKSLKYKNWSSTRLEKEIMQRLEVLDTDEAGSNDNDEEYIKLCLLNDFSRRFYNLNLLVYTLEYQSSLFNRMITTLNRLNPFSSATTSSRDNNQTPANMPDVKFDESTLELTEKLAHNIEHLKSCIVKKFEQFNSKLDEFEVKYPEDACSHREANMDLVKLYKQFQQSVMLKS